MQMEVLPPTPDQIIGAVIPLVGMLTGVLISGFVVLGPVGRAIGDVIRHLFGAGKHGQPALQRCFDVAGIQDVEKIQHVLTIWSLGHSPILPVLDSALVAGSL